MTAESAPHFPRRKELVLEQLPGNSAKIRVLLDLLELAPERVLDVGCGDLSLWAALRDRPQVIGVDVALPPARVAGIETRQASALALPFSEEFDAVVSTQMLDDLRDRPRALRELHRVLRPGGTLFLTCDAGERPRSWRARLRRVPRAPTLAQLRTEASAAGFEIERLRRYGRRDLKHIQGELDGSGRLRTLEQEEALEPELPREWGLLYLRARRPSR